MPITWILYLIIFGCHKVYCSQLAFFSIAPSLLFLYIVLYLDCHMFHKILDNIPSKFGFTCFWSVSVSYVLNCQPRSFILATKGWKGQTILVRMLKNPRVVKLKNQSRGCVLLQSKKCMHFMQIMRSTLDLL